VTKIAEADPEMRRGRESVSVEGKIEYFQVPTPLKISSLPYSIITFVHPFVHLLALRITRTPGSLSCRTAL